MKKPWNKGKKYGIYDESASVRFRRDKEYRLKELKENARRNETKRKDISWRRKRDMQAMSIRKKKNEIFIHYKRKKWAEEEEIFLKNNKGKNYFELALQLDRSLSSIEHKMERLKLQKYNKWQKELF